MLHSLQLSLQNLVLLPKELHFLPVVLYHLLVLPQSFLSELLQLQLNPLSDSNRAPLPHLYPVFLAFDKLPLELGNLSSVLHILLPNVPQLVLKCLLLPLHRFVLFFQFLALFGLLEANLPVMAYNIFSLGVLKLQPKLLYLLHSSLQLGTLLCYLPLLLSQGVLEPQELPLSFEDLLLQVVVCLPQELMGELDLFKFFSKLAYSLFAHDVLLLEDLEDLNIDAVHL